MFVILDDMYVELNELSSPQIFSSFFM